MGKDSASPVSARHRNPVITIAHEINIVNLDQLDRRKVQPLFVRSGDAQPALAGPFVKRVELVIKVIQAAFCPADAVQGNFLLAGIMPVSLISWITVQVKQAIRAAQEGGDEFVEATCRNGCVEHLS